ncbi:ABC transporter, ATP-binding protein [Azospirillum endophyticum]
MRGLTLSAAAGEVVALVGPSGCGKTTALGIVAGLDHAFDGMVEVGPRPDGGMAKLGYVFQEPRLLPWRSVRQNLALVLPRPLRRGPAVDAMLDALELSAFADRFPTQLSLGMARRVALARAFLVEPDLLLMDEPFVSLDEPTALRLRTLLTQLLDRRPATLLLVTHNLREALALADRLLLLAPSPGRVVAEVPVTVPRAARDDDMVEALRRDLLSRSEAAFRLLA